MGSPFGAVCTFTNILVPYALGYLNVLSWLSLCLVIYILVAIWSFTFWLQFGHLVIYNLVIWSFTFWLQFGHLVIYNLVIWSFTFWLQFGHLHFGCNLVILVAIWSIYRKSIMGMKSLVIMQFNQSSTLAIWPFGNLVNLQEKHKDEFSNLAFWQFGLLVIMQFNQSNLDFVVADLEEEDEETILLCQAYGTVLRYPCDQLSEDGKRGVLAQRQYLATESTLSQNQHRPITLRQCMSVQSWVDEWKEWYHLCQAADGDRCDRPNSSVAMNMEQPTMIEYNSKYLILVVGNHGRE
ncbi:hypothetical protein LXL04_009815 [Taraxacum kok-saghyz]